MSSLPSRVDFYLDVDEILLHQCCRQWSCVVCCLWNQFGFVIASRTCTCMLLVLDIIQFIQIMLRTRKPRSPVWAILKICDSNIRRFLKFSRKVHMAFQRPLRTLVNFFSFPSIFTFFSDHRTLLSSKMTPYPLFKPKLRPWAKKACVKGLLAVAETLRNIGGGGRVAKARDLYGGMGNAPPEVLKFGSLKWHLQHSESTFCKKFQKFQKYLI
jgi:hypothetical protein